MERLRKLVVELNLLDPAEIKAIEKAQRKIVDDAVDDSDAFRELAPRERTRIENAFQSTLSVTRDGGSSGRSTTMLAPELEWSATGRVGASLAHDSGVNFTLAASPRAASRLHHMRSSAYFNTSP